MKIGFPGYQAFSVAAHLHSALFPGSKDFSGNSRVARKIYLALDVAYRRGLMDGVWSEDPERRRIRLQLDRDAKRAARAFCKQEAPTR